MTVLQRLQASHKKQQVVVANPGKQTVDVASRNNHNVSRRTDVELETFSTRQR